MKKIILVLILLLPFRQVLAAELFGMELKASTLDQLRTAVKQAGATIIAEADDNRPYDTFESEVLFPGSSRLYIGHVQESRQTAFVEYEFNGLRHENVADLLARKYGDPQIRKARFLSDQSYHWTVNGVDITLWQDWENYRTLLSYVVPEQIGKLNSSLSGVIVDSSHY